MDFGILRLQVGGREGYILKHEQKAHSSYGDMFEASLSTNFHQLNDQDGHLLNPGQALKLVEI